MAVKRKIRYAAVSLGWITQTAMLPAFANASENSELTALISDDPEKLSTLGDKYGVEARFSYQEYDQALASGRFDAVYIGLPNSLHREYAERAARAGIHVLCEKPMAPSVDDCRAMIEACDGAGVRLMIAYRLHFEEANMTVVKSVLDGDLGEVKLFNSTFTEQVESGNIRLQKSLGGGPVEDIGIYCINAARYLFRDEPISVSAVAANTGEPRFREVDESVSATLLFPRGRVAQFVCGFGVSGVSSFRVVGAEGDILMDPAYSFQGERVMTTTLGGKATRSKFKERDQFAPQLIYFSKCVLEGTEPEPSGWEGLADVRIIEALHRSARDGQVVTLEPFAKDVRPSFDQVIKIRAPRKPKLVHAAGPSGD